MTSYNGQAITYDAIGNPLNYRDDITLTWQNGRELATYSDDNYDITYTYDASGMRTSKTTVFGLSINNYDYVYEGGQLLQMTRNNYVYDFSYDANGTPIGFNFISPSGAENQFYYGVNYRGDIVAVYNSVGTKIATYSYDAYGKPLTTTHHSSSYTTIVNNNPLRYRGYVYDNDTGFYYLQSRYYDPTTCRFINRDSQLNIDSFNGYNTFAYCSNNPILSYDPSGTRELVGGGSVSAEGAENRYWSCVHRREIYFITNDSSNSISGDFREGPFFGNGSLTVGYSTASTRGQGDKKLFPNIGEPSVTVGSFGKVSAVNGTGRIGIGNDNVSISLKGVADFLTASANAGVCYKDGLGLTTKAKAAVLSGRATIELDIYDWQIECGLTGDALSAGAEATIGVFDGSFIIKPHASLGAGCGFLIRVTPG